jgi:hypothetical protein
MDTGLAVDGIPQMGMLMLCQSRAKRRADPMGISPAPSQKSLSMWPLGPTKGALRAASWEPQASPRMTIWVIGSTLLQL